MKRTPDGKYVFNAEEVITLSLAVAARCRAKYAACQKAAENGYSSTYDSEEYASACKLYRDLFNRDFKPESKY